MSEVKITKEWLEERADGIGNNCISMFLYEADRLITELLNEKNRNKYSEYRDPAQAGNDATDYLAKCSGGYDTAFYIDEADEMYNDAHDKALLEKIEFGIKLLLCEEE